MPTEPHTRSRRIEAEHLDAWAALLDTHPARLRAAIAAVGDEVETVRRYLQGSASPPAARGRSGRGVESIVPHLHRQEQSHTRPADLDELFRNNSRWPH